MQAQQDINFKKKQDRKKYSQDFLNGPEKESMLVFFILEN